MWICSIYLRIRSEKLDPDENFSLQVQITDIMDQCSGFEL